MYNITGWSYGGRRPLSYNLMPGQFRNPGINLFSNPTIINNNIGGFGGCYDYDCGCGCGSSNKMSWMDWTMMGSMLLNGLGNIFACFWGGGVGGAEKTQAKPADDTDLKNLRTLYKNEYNIIQNSDNSFSARPKAGGKTITAPTATELMELLDGEQEVLPSTDGQGNIVTSELERQLQEAGITRTPDGKYKVNNVEYETLALAMQAVNKTTTIGEYTDESPAAGISKKSEFVNFGIFNTEYINNNYNPNLGLKYGTTYIKSINNITINTKYQGTLSLADATGLNEILPSGSEITINNETIQVGNYNDTHNEVTIGSTTYQIINNSGEYIYLQPKDSTSETTEKYAIILDTDSNISYKLYKVSDLENSRTEHQNMFTSQYMNNQPNSLGLYMTEIITK